MALSWNEIKDRAVKFSKEWADTTSEDAEAKSFLDAFFDVFGISLKRVGSFEHKVKILGLSGEPVSGSPLRPSSTGFIDLLWKGVILIEMKSAGKDLDKAFVQAKEYIQGLKESEIPKYILVCDFKNFRLYDSEERTTVEFKLADFVKNVQHFSLVAGYQKRTYQEQDPVNIRAAELLGKLHDQLKEVGYTEHPLEVFLVRLLFCLFAEDTTIFEKLQFQTFIEQKTAEDGSDIASKLQELFQVLDTPSEKRFKNLDEDLARFPFVNGKLFEETLPIASFDAKMRQALLNCCYLDWSKISPAIFGSMFQSVMNNEERRNLGAHYTSEKNILKLIKPLFLDDLWAEFDACKENKPKLIEFHKKLRDLKFLDPACGCGNFLVIAYRELRLLEIEILKKILKGDRVLNIQAELWLDVDMMAGIEIVEFPARIAEVAMWLIDHQMNMLASEEFGQYFIRLPLQAAPNIHHANALRMNWEDVVPKEKLSYIMGNPPFVGKNYQNPEQRQDKLKILSEIQNCSDLDYVASWIVKATMLIKNSEIQVGFVSTNSITQGEQAPLLWNWMFQNHIFINFAHRTFNWSNEARNKAAVHCVIIGFALFEKNHKFLFDYHNLNQEPVMRIVAKINGYLIEANHTTIIKRREPICAVPSMGYGSKPTDNGALLFDTEEKIAFLKKEPQAEKFFKRFMKASEFINNEYRYCLWLKDVEPQELKSMPNIIERLNQVRKFRLASTAKPTRESSRTPALFFYVNQPKSKFLLIPGISSENRPYIPIGFLMPDVIAGDNTWIVAKASGYHFGIIQSRMHMAWARTVSGRIKSDFQYSASIVYNNFPWPEDPSNRQVKAIETAAQKVLDVREEFLQPSPSGRGVEGEGASLANLYDPLTMPPKLVKAHNELDKAVDLAYRPYPFANDAKRMEWLFELYEKYTDPLRLESRDKIRTRKVSRKRKP
ncbi:MAG: class I SAM-dependent DNA methyltransferase [Spirochaetes bacterium]|nr:class I SAM-dependent DNA methyltransferase [Spirochaetota bacterium]